MDNVTGRCLVPACPVRWRDGPDRLCGEHAAEQKREATVPETMERIRTGQLQALESQELT